MPPESFRDHSTEIRVCGLMIYWVFSVIVIFIGDIGNVSLWDSLPPLGEESEMGDGIADVI